MYLRLKPEVTVDALPHLLHVVGDLALVVVPCRAPLCLRCRGKGHIWRESSVPRCAIWRRFGHEESQCVRTYAIVVGPLGEEDASEHLMNVPETEETGSGEGCEQFQASTPPESSSEIRTAAGTPASNVCLLNLGLRKLPLRRKASQRPRLWLLGRHPEKSRTS